MEGRRFQKESWGISEEPDMGDDLDKRQFLSERRDRGYRGEMTGDSYPFQGKGMLINESYRVISDATRISQEGGLRERASKN